MMWDISKTFEVEYASGFYCGIGCAIDGILLYGLDYHKWIVNEMKK